MIDLRGRVFGRLTVVERAGNIKRNVAWRCLCACGIETVAAGNRLREGKTTSCGCLREEKRVERSTVHGESKTRLFRIWAGMLTRCRNPNFIGWQNYGGRGIRVCQEWSSYVTFRRWAMEHGYRSDLTIDRIDVDGHYEPSNCRWATRQQQARNTRAGRLPDGRRRVDVAQEHNIPEATMRTRLKRGWDPLLACTVRKASRWDAHLYLAN